MSLDDRRLWMAALLVCIAGCAPENRDKEEEQTIQDADNDGDPDATDCAPDDPSIHADAEELCNAVDDDCDGEVDEGPTGYVDEDGDGYGASGAPLSSCDLPDGTELVDNGGDCDDDDDTVHPGADDLPCDGIDRDCDGRSEQVYTAEGGRYGTLDAALVDVDDGAELTICPGTHPTRAVLDRPISLTIRGETGDPDDVVLDGRGLATILYVGTGASVELADLTFYDGRGERWVDTDEGGALVIYESEVVLDNVYLEFNLASRGGAIAMYQDIDGSGASASLQMRASILNNNRAIERGGGLYLRGGAAEATIEIVDSLVDHNAALVGSGGGLALDSDGPAHLTVERSLFALNTAEGRGGCIQTAGAGDLDLDLRSSEFQENEVEGDGGCLDLGGQGLLALEMSDLDFADNVARSDGGALSSFRQGAMSADISDTRFTDNWTAFGDGGAMLLAPMGDSQLNLAGLVFGNNNAGASGGALAASPQGAFDLRISGSVFGGNEAWTDGGAVHVLPTAGMELEVWQSELTGNWAARNGGAISASVYGSGEADLVLRGVDLTANVTDGAESCAVHLATTVGLAATMTNWGTGDTENDRCDVMDATPRAFDLTGEADLSCTGGVCGAE